MLYVDMKVNDHPIKAFVDSGEQMTIMSLGCAQRLGLERLIDRRFQGTAKGVCTQKIIGKVHQAPIVIAARADAPRAVPLVGGRALPLAVLEEPAGA